MNNESKIVVPGNHGYVFADPAWREVVTGAKSSSTMALIYSA
jgi:hypothetical protein